MAVVMATACFISRMNVEKVVPNVTTTHTPPPTGKLPTFISEVKDTKRTK